MKSCTDIEQSKKLAEILPIESADMYYHPYPNDEDWYDIPNFGEADLKLNQLPCWSLAALLDLMPIINDDTYTMRGTLDNGAVISYEEVTCVMYQEKTPIDAAFEMIVWLKENKKI